MGNIITQSTSDEMRKYLTPVIQEVQLSGSKLTGPTLINQTLFSDLPAPGTYKYVLLTNVLTRNATRRALTIFNNTDQQIKIGSLGVYDSISGSSSQSIIGGAPVITLNAGQSTTVGYSAFADINDPVDSLLVAIQFVTTAGTTGAIKTWLTEVIGS